MNRTFIKDKYRVETNNDVYSDSGSSCYNSECSSYSDEYVKWLEIELAKKLIICTDFITTSDSNYCDGCGEHKSEH